jgi:hypothetical protein
MEEWENRWQMAFHPEKCVVIRVSNKRKPINARYTIHGHMLQEVDSSKYLGGWIVRRAKAPVPCLVALQIAHQRWSIYGPLVVLLAFGGLGSLGNNRDTQILQNDLNSMEEWENSVWWYEFPTSVNLSTLGIPSTDACSVSRYQDVGRGNSWLQIWLCTFSTCWMFPEFHGSHVEQAYSKIGLTSPWYAAAPTDTCSKKSTPVNILELPSVKTYDGMITSTPSLPRPIEHWVS